MNKLSVSKQRCVYSILFLVSIALLGFGFYLQYMLKLEPCPLCIFQRVAYMAIALFSLVIAIHAPSGWLLRLYHGLVFIPAVLGLAIAGRQTWLQHLPKDLRPECGPDLSYMFDTLPIFDALRLVLQGSGECAKVQWQFIGLSIAEWSLIWFLLFSIISLIMLIWHNYFWG